MRYKTLISVIFPVPPDQVFTALIDLGGFLTWNSGMISVRPSGVMREGMEFETTSIVLGQKTVSNVTVMRLVPNQEIALANHKGAISFTASYRLAAQGNQETKLTCTLEFEVHSLVLNFAHAAVEAMAKARIKGDLETLRAQLTPSANRQEGNAR